MALDHLADQTQISSTWRQLMEYLNCLAAEVQPQTFQKMKTRLQDRYSFHHKSKCAAVQPQIFLHIFQTSYWQYLCSSHKNPKESDNIQPTFYFSNAHRGQTHHCICESRDKLCYKYHGRLFQTAFRTSRDRRQVEAVPHTPIFQRFSRWVIVWWRVGDVIMQSRRGSY